MSLAGRTILVMSLAGALAACSSILGFHEVTLGGPDDAGAPGLDATSPGEGGGGPDIFVPNDQNAPDGATDGPKVDANCGDTVTSAANCGRCGHSCLGGTCVASKCLPLPLIKGLFDSRGIAIDDTSVYVTIQFDKKVLKANKSDGKNFVTIAADTNAFAARGIAVDATGVYYTDDSSGNPPLGRIQMCPLTGCAGNAPFIIYGAADDPTSVALRGPNVFWAERNGGLVRRAPKTMAGANPTNLLEADAGLQPFKIALDDSFLYFTDISNNSLGVAKVPLDGGALVQLVNGAGQTNGIALSSTGVFWSSGGASDGTIGFLPKNSVDAGLPPAFATQQRNPNGIAVDATNVYWTAAGSPNVADGSIMMCPIAGCAGAPIELASGQAQPVSIAVDADAVYWVNNGLDNTNNDGAVVKVAKP